jgi:hypothetical protein
MTSNQKKAFLLLEAVVFGYDGLNEQQEHLLHSAAAESGALEVLNWVKEFLSSDPVSAFDRARIYLNKLTEHWDNEARLQCLGMVWEVTSRKGHITEMEATALLRVAKDWKLQRELIGMVRGK